MTDIIQSILALKADAEISVDANDVNKINWIDNNPTNITKAQILAKQVELQAAYDDLDYQRKRAPEYAPLQEQLDQLYHDMAADKGDKTGEWFKAVKKVKDDNPKS